MPPNTNLYKLQTKDGFRSNAKSSPTSTLIVKEIGKVIVNLIRFGSEKYL